MELSCKPPKSHFDGAQYGARRGTYKTGIRLYSPSGGFGGLTGLKCSFFRQ